VTEIHIACDGVMECSIGSATRTREKPRLFGNMDVTQRTGERDATGGRENRAIFVS